MYQIILAKNFALSIVMLMFGIWNWYLAILGQSVIEFMQKREENKDDFSYELENWRENLFVIFGTSNFIEMLLPID